jgi:hypothetical protein
MRPPRSRWLLSALLAGAIGLALSCADPSPLGVRAPASAPQADLLGLLPLRTGLVGCSPLAATAVTQTIGPAGGTLQVGPHTLSVPAGALDAAVSITAVAPADTVNRIQLQPEGLTFAEPASLTMSYANCDVLALALRPQIVYTTDLLQILEYLHSVGDPLSQTVTAPLQHFSSYAIAW